MRGKKEKYHDFLSPEPLSNHYSPPEIGVRSMTDEPLFGDVAPIPARDCGEYPLHQRFTVLPKRPVPAGDSGRISHPFQA
jgi:hypothetical protein